MIGRISGTVISRNDPYILIDVHGVGYQVYASAPVLLQTHLEQLLTVFTYLHVREDLVELYGFLSQLDLQLFHHFLNVSGIGPKTAIGIFSIGKREEIIQAIQKADVDFFTSVPRLGKKNAQKLIIELKNKVGGLVDVNLIGETNADNLAVISALTGMGFSEGEAREALRKVSDENLSVSEKIKRALKTLSNV